MIVADASVVFDLLVGGGSPGGDTLAAHLLAGELVAAPHLVDVEVAQVVRRHVLRRTFDGAHGTALVEDLTWLPVRRYPHRFLVARALELHENVTVYDGVYLALAEALHAPLLTGDAALADVPGCDASVEVVRTTP